MASEPPERSADAMPARLAQPGQSGRPKRFFNAASVEPRGDVYAVLLDGRLARTPARRDLALPTSAAADLVAGEWNRLGDLIDPAAMPLTRLANSAIDGVADQVAPVFEEVMGYVASDLLLYRADSPERLVSAQAAAWDPVLELFRGDHGARFVLAQGIIHVAQPPATLSLVRQVLGETVGLDGAAPFRLACVNVMTTLTGSALLALAVARRDIDAQQAWDAAHVDERFQESHWGEDAEALARRASRWLDMQAAATLFMSLRAP